MRILHVANHCGKANGNVNVAVDIACCQSKLGHEVAFASSGGDFVTLMQDCGVTHFDVPQPHHGFVPFAFPLATVGLWGAIAKFRPDVVHLHMAAHNICLQPLRLFGLKTVTTVHNEFDKTVWIMGLADRVISVSKAGAEAMRERGVPAERSRIILNIVVLASHADPGPLVIAEARRAGLGIVATAVDGIPEMLDFGTAGVLVPPKSPEALSQAILEFIEDGSKLSEFGARAAENTERFTIERVCRDLDGVYAELTSQA